MVADVRQACLSISETVEFFLGEENVFMVCTELLDTSRSCLDAISENCC